MNVEDKFKAEYPSLYETKLNQLFKNAFKDLKDVELQDDGTNREFFEKKLIKTKEELDILLDICSNGECQDSENFVPAMVRNYILLQKYILKFNAKFQDCLGPNPTRKTIDACAGTLASQTGGKRYRKKTHRRKNKRNKKSRRR